MNSDSDLAIKPQRILFSKWSEVPWITILERTPGIRVKDNHFPVTQDDWVERCELGDEDVFKTIGVKV